MEWFTNMRIFSRIGVFSTLTNSYALVALGASENFYRWVMRILDFQAITSSSLDIARRNQLGLVDFGKHCSDEL